MYARGDVATASDEQLLPPGGHVRRLVVEALHAADHHVTGLPEHD